MRTNHRSGNNRTVFDSEELRSVIETALRPRMSAVEVSNGAYSDLVGDAIASVLERANDPLNPIDNLTGYARQVARHKFDDYIRSRRPNYWSTEGSIRYLCSKQIGICIWLFEGSEVVGEDGNRGMKPSAMACKELSEALARGRRLSDLVGQYRSDKRGDILLRLLAWASAPITLDLAVRALCIAQGLEDPTFEPIPRTDSPDGSRSAIDRLSARDELEGLWRELSNLPLRQRQALLLNSRSPDGESALDLLLASGVASIEEMAAALGKTVTDVERLWSELPMPDHAIGHQIGVTEKQVSNLRLVARLRLKRQMQALGYD